MQVNQAPKQRRRTYRAHGRINRKWCCLSLCSPFHLFPLLRLTPYFPHGPSISKCIKNLLHIPFYFLQLTCPTLVTLKSCLRKNLSQWLKPHRLKSDSLERSLRKTVSPLQGSRVPPILRLPIFLFLFAGFESQ